MGEDDGEWYECSRCGEDVYHEDAVALAHGSGMYKILCADCLEAVGVPRGYELIRDVSRE